MKKLLIIGSLTNKKDPTKTGGVTVLTELLLTELRERNVDFDVIDTLKENYPNALVAYLLTLYKLIKNIRKYEIISLQASTNSLLLLGPVMIFLARLFNKKTNIRKFAGNFQDVYTNSNKIQKSVIKYTLENSDANFFETKYLVNYFTKFNKNTYWFPNVRRKINNKKFQQKEFKKKFIFIGTVNKEKGIDEICTVAQKLSDDYVLDIYGPLYDKKYSQSYFDSLNVSYKGALKSEEVLEKLNQYDVLVLPSYREGYPGVIVEAFSLGIPVIATKLEGIMEMVEEYKNGFLIDVQDSEQLLDAIHRINCENYKYLSQQAYNSFDNFDSKIQTDLFLARSGF